MLRALQSAVSMRREEGQDLLEYAMLASLIAVFCLAAVRLMGDRVGDVLWGAIVASPF